MATQEFNCPNCGAPLDYKGSGATMRCPFCETSVVVPAEIRTPQRTQHVPPLNPIQTTPITAASPANNWRAGLLLSIFLVGIVLFVGAMIAVPIILTRRASEMAQKIVEPAKLLQTAIPLATHFPAPTEVPIPTPTAAFANLVNTFGSSGIGSGMLNDARYIAVDGSGTVYVADYEDGRIQAFNANGKFLHGWQVGDANTIIYGLTATHEGSVYVAYEGDIYRFEGSSGKALGKLDYANGQEFGDLTPLPDGGILAAWYEARWGIITSLAGHRDDLVWFDADGKTVRTLKSAISEQTGDVALETSLAVDGVGNVYALSGFDNAVFKFTSQGKFVDRFDVQGSDSSHSQEASCLAVDGQGRVYVGGGNQITIFSPDGKVLLSSGISNSVYKMAFSEQGDLYIVSGDTVSRYTPGELP